MVTLILIAGSFGGGIDVASVEGVGAIGRKEEVLGVPPIVVLFVVLCTAFTACTAFTDSQGLQTASTSWSEEVTAVSHSLNTTVVVMCLTL